MAERLHQMIRVGEQQVSLPKGVTLPQWTLEKYRWQNPRIRSLMGCVKLLESVLESNYAILHCSPVRLHEIWRQVLQVAELIQTELAALFTYPSVIPPLEEARQFTASARRTGSQSLCASRFCSGADCCKS